MYEGKFLKTREQAIRDIRFRKLVESLQLSELTELKSQKGALNPYVSGLLLSATLMEEFRQEAPFTVSVGWGQILDENDNLSSEIDVFTYQGKPIYQWKNIGYVIVNKDDIQSIFEVKRKFYSYSYHKEDFERLHNFAERVYLIIFETYNSLNGIKNCENKLRKIGYADAFHLVRLKDDNETKNEPIYENWYKLMDTVSQRTKDYYNYTQHFKE